MIGVIFERANEILEVRIAGANLYFRNSNYGMGFYPIESLHLDKAGSIKENPDLAEDPEWKEKSIDRLKNKLKTMEREDDKADYVIEELKKIGFVPKFKQKQGFRPEKIK